MNNMVWLLLWLFPSVTQAATLPQPSDVVFIHDGVNEDQQSDYNYIFTIDGDDTIYTCQANRCSLGDFRDQSTITATFYELPEGYQRVATIVDQTILEEYRTNAAEEFRLEGLETTLTATNSSRSYYTVTIFAEGSFELDTTSQERNVVVEDDTIASIRWIWWLIGGGVVIAGGAGFILWKRRF